MVATHPQKRARQSAMKDRLIHKWFISMVRVIPFSGLGKKNINVVYWLAGWASIVETYLKPNVQKNNHNALWRMENKQWNKPAPHTLVSTQNRLAQIVDGLLSSFSVFKLQSGGKPPYSNRRMLLWLPQAGVALNQKAFKQLQLPRRSMISGFTWLKPGCPKIWWLMRLSPLWSFSPF